MIIVGLFGLPLSTVCAQTMFSVEKGLEKYALPLTSSIKVGENGSFTAYYDNRTYELPLGSKIHISAEELHLPLTLKDIDWKPGVSSLQSGSNGLLRFDGGNK